MFVLNSFPPRNKTTPSKKYFIKKSKAQLLPITNEYMMNIFDKRAEVRNVKKLEICADKNLSLKILHDPSYSLDERIMKEQFLT